MTAEKIHLVTCSQSNLIRGSASFLLKRVFNKFLLDLRLDILYNLFIRYLESTRKCTLSTFIVWSKSVRVNCVFPEILRDWLVSFNDVSLMTFRVFDKIRWIQYWRKICFDSVGKLFIKFSSFKYVWNWCSKWKSYLLIKVSSTSFTTSKRMTFDASHTFPWLWIWCMYQLSFPVLSTTIVMIMCLRGYWSVSSIVYCHDLVFDVISFDVKMTLLVCNLILAFTLFFHDSIWLHKITNKKSIHEIENIKDELSKKDIISHVIHFLDAKIDTIQCQIAFSVKSAVRKAQWCINHL